MRRSMREKAKTNRRDNIDDLKGVVRKVEGLIEVFILMLCYYLNWKYFYRNTMPYAYYGYGKFILVFVYAFLVLVLFFLCDSFKYGHRKLGEVVISQWISMLIVNIVTYLQLCLIANYVLNPLPLLCWLSGMDIAVTLLCSYVYTVIYHRMYAPKNMVMIYGNEKAVDLKFKMDTRPDKYCITKVMSYEEGYPAIREEIQKHDAVIINDVPAQIRNDIMKYCYTNEVRTYVVPKVSDIISRGAEEINLFDTPLLLVKGTGLNPAQRAIKRLFDIFLSLIAMIPGLPIMGVVALCIKLEDRGPVFYRQARVTRGGRVFDILKFRSMIVNAEKDGRSIPATEHDPRITKVGHIIRATRIDELPQIINIFKGDMSWVGPRPERVQHMEEYSKDVPEFVLRTKVKGGLTGYAQIYGRYNTSAYDKLRLDLMYIENYSIFLDIKLILMTIQIMLKKESTEGFDKSEEMALKRHELLLHKEVLTGLSAAKDKNGEVREKSVL